jgi:hypothetical protein
MSHRLSGPTPLLAALLLIAGSGCGGSPIEPEEMTIPVFSHGAAHGEFGTHMNGGQETPARATRATGQLVLRPTQDGSGLHFKLIAANIVDVLQSHIHLAPPGVAGPVVVWLYPAAPPAVLIPGRFNGVLAEGLITDAQVVGPLAGQGVAGLIAAIRAGNAYANVHTVLYPPGEIRGQLD